MTCLINPTERKWRPLLRGLGPWECWHAYGPNKYGWSRFTVRLRDAGAARRSWWLDYHAADGRVARSEDSTHLATNHGDVFKQLMLRLRQWQPD
jgi:hypothetical protein